MKKPNDHLHELLTRLAKPPLHTVYYPVPHGQSYEGNEVLFCEFKNLSKQNIQKS